MTNFNPVAKGFGLPIRGQAFGENKAGQGLAFARKEPGEWSGLNLANGTQFDVSKNFSTTGPNGHLKVSNWEVTRTAPDGTVSSNDITTARVGKAGKAFDINGSGFQTIG